MVAGEPLQVSLNPRRWRLLTFVSLAQFMVLLDTTAVNLALPSIQLGLGAGAGAVEWVLTGYVLCFGGLMLLGGRTADRWGRRRTFLLGAGMFIVSSAVCGVAPGVGWLIAARAVQGVAAAFLSPAAMSLVTSTFPDGRERATALGVWAALAGLGATAGVLVGGFITESLSWRWIFFINLPLGIVACVGALMFAPGRTAVAAIPGKPDLAGALTCTLGLGLLVYAIVDIHVDGAGSRFVLVPGALAVAVLALFVGIERRVKDPLIPTHLFTTRSLAAAAIGRVLTSAVQAALLFLISFYLQRAQGYSADEAGFALLPFAVMAVVATTVVIKIVHRVGPRPAYIAGATGTVLGMIWLAQIPPHGSALRFMVPALVLLGLAMQGCGISVNVLGLSEMPSHQQGIAAGALTAAFQIGASLGIVVVAATSAISDTTRAVEIGTDPAIAWNNDFTLGCLITAGIAFLNLLNALIGVRSAVSDCSASSGTPTGSRPGPTLR
ncbi:MFS transporter [Pseudonocardia spinosispora]|uniref:MFS transporter n=1 Tax=Pseudonocardia spinosispora TaxID=103441 RepID=UPI0004054FDE|nr:MFS transporter [Pseudonocardia spinosispora]